MRELQICEGESGGAASTGTLPVFRYSILVDELEVDGFSCESYGVCVANADGSGREAIPNLTISVSRIDALMELLMRNQVGPIPLRDVVDDWL